MQPAAATTVGEWVAQLDPRPPVALHERLTALLAPGANRPVADVAEICVDTGVRLLDEMLASEATDRAHALDLLAVDALITYAFQVAADEPARIESRAAAAMARIAALSVAGAPNGAGAR